MDTIWIESTGVRVGVIPEFGARVVSLIDKGSGRDWIFQGGVTPQTGEDAAYLEDEAVGWDECFPTVSPYDARATGWRRWLRDHGDLWGRPWAVTEHSASTLTTIYHHLQFSFTRALMVEGNTLTASYRVINLTQEPLPYLWALHALLAVSPADRIELAEAQSTVATFFTLDGISGPGTIPFAWPGPTAQLPVRFDEVQPASRHMASKVIARGVPSRSVALGHAKQWLRIAWNAPLDDLGIWLNYGGWPAPGTLHHIALEPTSSPADNLGQAIEQNAKPIEAGIDATWTVRLTVGDRAPI